MSKSKLYVKSWFARKATKFRCYDVDVFAILEETEKAVKVFMASDTCGIEAYWCPKSCLVLDKNDSFDPLNEKETLPEFTAEELEEMIDGMKIESWTEAYRAFKDYSWWGK